MKTQPFLKEAKNVSMTARERDHLRERIVSYMEYHPLHLKKLEKHTQSFGHYTTRLTAVFGSFRFRTVASVFALLFFIVIPAVAEQALPGDTLYPVKVRFNEGIRSQLLFSPYEKMQWEAKRIERRIAEARLLVKEGKLTEETQSALEETVRSHATAFQAQLAELRESDASGAAIAEVTLESALDVQSAVLNTQIAQEASSTNPNEGDVNGLAAIVREARADVASSTDNASDSASYEPLAARIEENTTRIHALSQSLMTELTDAQKTEIEERTTHVDADIVAAQKAHDKEKDDTAVPLLRSALATTEKIIAFMSSLDLRSNVSLDTLVPDMPDQAPVSDETRATVLAEKLASLKEKHTELLATLDTLEEPEKTEQTKQAETLVGLIEKGTSALAENNLDEAERLVTEAEAVIANLEKTQQE